MFSKALTTFALFALTAQVVVATPPACLIDAVNGQNDRSDIKGICSNNASAVQDLLNKNCGGSKDIAMSAFSSVCSDAGVTVAAPSSTASGNTASPSGTTTGSGMQTSASGHSNPTHSATISGIPSRVSGSVAAETSGNVAVRVGMDCVGMAALGAFGVMLAL